MFFVVDVVWFMSPDDIINDMPQYSYSDRYGCNADRSGRKLANVNFDSNANLD